MSLFDFDIPNLTDILIESKVNGRLLLNSGQYINPGVTIRLSSIPMSLEAFKKNLPTSSLPAYIREGSVKLTPITLDTPTIMTPAEKPIHPSLKIPDIEEASVLDVPTLKIEAEGNPFSDEDNQAALDLQAKQGPAKKVAIKAPAKKAPVAPVVEPAVTIITTNEVEG